MFSAESWKLRGYRNLPIPNTFFRNDPGNHRLSLLFPGYGYTSQAPLLFYIQELFAENGYDVLSIDYAYNKNEEFLDSPDPVKDRWFTADIAAVYEAVREQGGYEAIAFIGKSLGATALLRIIQAGLEHERAVFIWLTPATNHAEIYETIRTLKHPSLILVGEADRYYDRNEISAAAGNPEATVKVFPNAGHSLEIENDLFASIENLKTAMGHISSFLRRIP